MTQLSIIIPCIGSQSSFDDTLLSVLENRPKRTEVIVPCRSDYVDPYDLDDEVVFLRCGEQSDVVELLNSGINASQGDIVHWIQPGHQATPNWAEVALQRFSEQDSISAVSPIIVDGESQRIVSAGVSYLNSGDRKVVRHGKKRNTVFNVMGPTLSAGFCRAHILTSADGFSLWTGSELTDVDFAALLDSANLACVVDSDCRLIGQKLAISTGFHAARRLERLYWKQSQRPNAKPNLVGHLIRIAWYSAIRFPRLSFVTSLFGRFVGMLDARKNPDNTREIVKRLRSSNKNSPTEIEHRRAA